MSRPLLRMQRQILGISAQIMKGRKSHLQSDLESRFGAAEFSEWAEEQGEQLAEFGLTRSGWVQLRKKMFEARKVRSVKPKDGICGLAEIRASEGGYEIYYASFLNQESRMTDRRFAVAHELAHTYFFNPEIPGVPLSPYQKRFGVDPDLEELVNKLAVTILVPRRLIIKYLRMFDGSGKEGIIELASIPKLAEHFRVPGRLMARRLVHDLGGKKCAVFMCEPDKSAQSGSWRIRWSAVPGVTSEERKAMEGLKIPRSMIPCGTTGRSEQAAIDGRWRKILEPPVYGKRRRPLRCESDREQIDGWCAVADEEVIVGFDV